MWLLPASPAVPTLLGCFPNRLCLHAAHVQCLIASCKSIEQDGSCACQECADGFILSSDKAACVSGAWACCAGGVHGRRNTRRAQRRISAKWQPLHFKGRGRARLCISTLQP